jgi:hypothetical protein
MPLTGKGEKIMRNMKREYGEKEGERNFYASKNAGTISGVDQIKGSEMFKARGQNINTNSFVPGGRRR